jgi:hypothetical protein
VPILSRVGLGAALAACCASALSAQTGAAEKATRLWNLQGLRAGYCVRFLVDPETAGRELKDGLVLLRADRDEALHSALRHVMQSQHEFSSWSPSSLCFYYTDAIQVGGRRIAEKNARLAQMIGVWSVAAVERGSGARRDLVLDMYASRERMRSAASAELVLLHEAEAGFQAPTDSSGTEYRQKIGKTQLIWSGRTAGDSLLIDKPIVETWRVAGARGVTWSAQLTLTPRSSRALVGSLRVEGKGDLAKMLKASPIRFVGPFYHGGGGQLRFTR